MAFLAAILSFTLLILSPVATSSPPLNSTSSVSAAGEGPTAYDLLKLYDFPIGILPKGVKSYTLDEATGDFSATWGGQCSFSLEDSYQLRYRSKITGQISKGKLARLSGISVKVLFLWLNIGEVVRRGDDMEFSVGFASASFPIDNFFECPQCGCGLDCVNGGEIRKLKFKVNSILNPLI